MEQNKTLINNPRIATKVRRIPTNFLLFVAVSFLFVAISGVPSVARASTLLVGPSGGTFTVGNTFDVSVLLNTQGKSINTVKASMSFPADKLQLVSPTAGKSIIEIWTAAPQFNNQSGRIELQGGIPGGINVSSGLITTLTFRVKAVGSATLKFLDDSLVLLNDGLGTNSLANTTSGVYNLTLPPPAGPIVASITHPQQSAWYSNPNVSLGWDLEEGGAEGYSYILNKEPVDSLDNISDGQKTSIVYKNLTSGVYYFHIKALRSGVFGGITHFAIQVDTLPPAEFPVDIIPSSRTTRKQPVVQFQSTDEHSGIDHYELKVIPLNLLAKTDQPLFIEAESPYILSPLELGKYDIIVRAYDKAGNYREITKHLSIVTTAFNFIGSEGIEIGNVIFIPWFGFWVISVFLMLILIYGALKIKKWHDFLDLNKSHKLLPREVQKQLDELRRYKSRYGPKTFLLLFLLGASLLIPHFISAQQVELTPPLINTVSRNISNEEIFYVGGKTDVAEAKVILYLQNLEDGQTISHEVISDKSGDWFYRHDNFLSTGDYLLWTQGKVGDQLSPPSPQVQMTVRSTAIQFGSSRISYEILYFILVVILFIITVGLIIYIAFHAYHGRKKHMHFVKEIREAEESVRRGFAVLRGDIRKEFDFIQKAKLNKVLSNEELAGERQLLKDLQEIEKYIGKEIWDIEEAEYTK